MPLAGMPLRLLLGKVLPFVYELELFARFIWCLLWTLFSQLQLLIKPTILADPIMCISSSRILKIVGFAF